MEYSEFCQEIETCIEKMCSYLKKAYDAHGKIYYNRRMYSIGKDKYEPAKAMESIRSSVYKQVEHKLNKIRYLGEFECWQNYYSYLTNKYRKHVEKYNQENPGKISYYHRLDFHLLCKFS